MSHRYRPRVSDGLRALVALLCFLEVVAMFLLWEWMSS